MTRHVVFVVHPDYAHYVEQVSALLVARGVRVETLWVTEAGAEVERLAASSLVVTVHSVRADVARLMSDLKGRTPTLTLQDGVIEHRHANHEAAGGVLRYRPLHTDQIAVFGARSAGLLRSFGVSPDRIAVTGSCRIGWDDPVRKPPADGYLLITAANRPAFDLAGTAAFYRALDRILVACGEQGVPFRLRLSRGVNEKGGLCRIGLVRDQLPPELVRRFRATPVSTDSLADDLRGARAALTTPSTVTLEAMAAGVPVGHIEFDDDTAFLHPAWRVRQDTDVAAVIRDMMAPSDLKMMYQDCLLRENLEPGDSAERIVRHMERMMADPQRAFAAR
ncbi:hypothetical protein ACFQ4O_01190 [Methylopila musalis]|uniref:Uncharacterized protein n=1 Tax=Methylopila musalis TaxID=1134781 RepID=A0ABW3Z415_9HYPH